MTVNFGPGDRMCEKFIYSTDLGTSSQNKKFHKATKVSKHLSWLIHFQKRFINFRKRKCLSFFHYELQYKQRLFRLVWLASEMTNRRLVRSEWVILLMNIPFWMTRAYSFHSLRVLASRWYFTRGRYCRSKKKFQKMPCR